jgi:hypothetical protein
MAPNPNQAVAAVGESAARAAEQARQLIQTAAARTREEAEDMYAEAEVVARSESGRDAAVYVALGAGAAVGLVGLPVAAAAGAGYALLRRRRHGG